MVRAPKRNVPPSLRGRMSRVSETSSTSPATSAERHRDAARCRQDRRRVPDRWGRSESSGATRGGRECRGSGRRGDATGARTPRRDRRGVAGSEHSRTEVDDQGRSIGRGEQVPDAGESGPATLPEHPRTVMRIKVMLPCRRVLMKSTPVFVVDSQLQQCCDARIRTPSGRDAGR